MNIDALCGALGLTLNGAKVSRDSQVIDLAGYDRIHPRDWFFALLGARIGLDRIGSTYDFADERPSHRETIRNVYDQPPPYGNRVQYLLPRRSIRVAEEASGVKFETQDWVDDDFTVVCLREVGKSWHVFAQDDYQYVEFGREDLFENARLSLFYQNYKPRPTIESHSWGTLRVFESSHGILTSSIALLFPDYDYDAARAQGILTVPSRQCVVVAEPVSGRHPDALEACLRYTRVRAHEAQMPMSRAWYQLGVDGVTFGNHWQQEL